MERVTQYSWVRKGHGDVEEHLENVLIDWILTSATAEIFFFHLLEIDFFSCTISQLWFPLPLLFPVLQFSSTSPPILIHPLSVSQIVQTMIHRSLEFLSSSNYLYFIHATSFVMCFIVSDCQEVHCNKELTLLKKARSYTNALQNRNETLSKNQRYDVISTPTLITHGVSTHR